MTFLNTIPLIGALVAVVLAVVVFTSKVQGKSARAILGLIVLFNAHNLMESYFIYNDISWPGLGLSYFHYHLIGPLFLLYAHTVFKIPIGRKFWVFTFAIYTVVRVIFISLLPADILSKPDDYPLQFMVLLLDYYVAILFNIGMLLLSFLLIQRVRLAVQLDSREKLNFSWLKSLILLAIGTYIAIWISGVVSFFDGEQWLFYEKLESMFTSIFPLFVSFAAMRFPVFAVTGDYKDLPVDSEKYSKSSLTMEDADEIWKEILAIMDDEKPYLNPEYRLNELSVRVGKSLHHVSQVINEKMDLSFSDFINQYRVKDAQALLTSDRAKQVTILAICYEAGFNSKTAFYNTFKKFTGQTPTEFKRQQQA